MNLKHLSDEKLNSDLKKLVKKERVLMCVILFHIAEVERRKLYLKRGHTNLYLYLEKEMEYYGGTQQRYKDAALLLMDVPTLAQRMADAEICMAQVELIQRSVRAKKGKVTREQKQKLVEVISGLTVAQSQVIVAKALDLKIKSFVKITHQKDGSVRMEVTYTKEQWEIMNEAREHILTALPSGDWAEVHVHLAKKTIKRKTTVRKEPTAEDITEAKRKFVIHRDKCCQENNCGSKWNLQVDHIIPRWAGGTNELSNLRAVCANHNRERYREQAGIQMG